MEAYRLIHLLIVVPAFPLGSRGGSNPRSQSHEKKSSGFGPAVMETHSAGARARATFMNTGASEPELCHFHDSSAALFLSKHILEVSSASCAPQCVRDSLGFG